MAFPFSPASSESISQIYSDLRINEERHNLLLKSFTDWIISEPYLPNDIADRYLSNFLALCKDDLTKAKVKFEKNIICRKSLAPLNRTWSLPTKDFLTSEIYRCVVPLPQLTRGGNRIINFSFPANLDIFDLSVMQKYGSTIGDMLLLTDQCSGIVVIGDYANCSVEMISKVSVTTTVQFLKCIIEIFPNRLMAFYLINFPLFAKPIVALVQATFPQKLRERVVIHENPSHLRDHLSRDVLPSDYEGKLPSLDIMSEDWKKYYLENEEWKSELKKLKLRGDVPKEKLYLDPTSGFGAEGNFRNLQVD